MESFNYLDFDLQIQRTTEGYRAQVLNSPAGQASADFIWPFSNLELENFLLKIGRPRRGGDVRRAESPETEAIKTFGGKLFAAVFREDVQGCLRSSLDEASRRAAGLRIRLRLVGAPDLADTPWEYLYNPGLNRFLALSRETPVVRYLDLPERISSLTVSPPLRVLVMIASPSNFPKLDTTREWQRLEQATAPLVERGVLALERLPGATLAALQKQLRRDNCHIFHFIGHGGFDVSAQDGFLVLENEDGLGRQVSGQDLGMMLHDARSLRLAVLNACEGARSSRTDPFSGTAQSLAQQSIPAVIAMQFEITDAAAIAFAQEFYGAVSDGFPVDAALSEARKAIFSQGLGMEWGTPVLYLRSPDGKIFDLQAAAARVITPRVPAPVPKPIPVPQPAPIRPPSAPLAPRIAAFFRAVGSAVVSGTSVVFGGAFRVLARLLRWLLAAAPSLAAWLGEKKWAIGSGIASLAFIAAGIQVVVRVPWAKVWENLSSPSADATKVQPAAPAEIKQPSPLPANSGGGAPTQPSAGGAQPAKHAESPPAAPPAVPTGPIHVEGKTQAAKLIHMVDPDYPLVARNAHIQGPVLFRVTTDPDGGIQAATLVSGQPLLVKAARDALMQWRYSPTVMNGRRVAVQTNVEIDFKLKETPSPVAANVQPPPKPEPANPQPAGANPPSQPSAADHPQPAVPKCAVRPVGVHDEGLRLTVAVLAGFASTTPGPNSILRVTALKDDGSAVSRLSPAETPLTLDHEMMVTLERRPSLKPSPESSASLLLQVLNGAGASVCSNTVPYHKTW